MKAEKEIAVVVESEKGEETFMVKPGTPLKAIEGELEARRYDTTIAKCNLMSAKGAHSSPKPGTDFSDERLVPGDKVFVTCFKEPQKSVLTPPNDDWVAMSKGDQIILNESEMEKMFQDMMADFGVKATKKTSGCKKRPDAVVLKRTSPLKQGEPPALEIADYFNELAQDYHFEVPGKDLEKVLAEEEGILPPGVYAALLKGAQTAKKKHPKTEEKGATKPTANKDKSGKGQEGA